MKKAIPLICVIAVFILLSCKKDNPAEPQSPALVELTLNGSASSAWYGTGLRQENYIAKAFISLSQEKTLSYAEAERAQSDLDIVCATSYFAGNIPVGSRSLQISSLSSGRGWDTNTADRKLDGFGVRTKCYFKLLPDHQSTALTALKTVQDLDKLFADIGFRHRGEIEYIYANDATTAASGQAYNIAFQTESGRRGVLRLLNYSANKPFSYQFRILVEPVN